jgi:hypothetical protein
MNQHLDLQVHLVLPIDPKHISKFLARNKFVLCVG